MNNRTILVSGATGHQGGAVARHLLQHGFTVHALVRDPNAPAAQALQTAGAILVEGNLNDRASLDRALLGVDGAFSVQSMEGGLEVEIEQGKALANAALAANTKHFVYSSVGSAGRKTGIPHFDSKFQIEEHIRAIGLPHTILRPVFFLFNYDSMRPLIEKGTLSGPLGADTKLQQISEDDYGHMVADVFERPAQFLNSAIEVASVDMTMTEVAAALGDVTGHAVAYQPISFEAFEQGAGHETTRMYRWFENVGYDADFAQLEREFGAPTGLKSYLRDHGWAKAAVPTMTEEQIDSWLQQAANGFSQQLRSPLMHTPSEQGLDYEEVSFPSSDGTPLEGWFIPADGSDKIIITNHSMGFSRSGLPSQLEPWKSLWASSGNDYEVNLIPDYKILHDAGYNVLTYDLRNFGHSSQANGGIGSSGIFESRDVVGSLQYVRCREDTQHMTIGLFSRCLGCNATLYAMKSNPAAFEGVRCLVGCQPLDTKTVVIQQLSLAGVPVDRIDDLEKRIILKTSIGFEQRNPQGWAKSVCVPTFLYQVHDDVLTKPVDVQTIFDYIPVADKKLFWIEGTTRRWDGYLYFQRHPDQMLQWFAAHMA